MAKKYYDKEIDFTVDWGGDVTTDGAPVAGNRVQEVIKKEVNSKVGYLSLYEEGGYYVLCRDEAAFNDWKETVSIDKPFGDESLIVGHFDAPYNYSMKITLLDPQGGYKSSLAGSTGNEIRFYATTVDKDDSPVSENITVTFKVTNENGVSSQYKSIYDYNVISNMTEGVSYQLDGKLSPGRNMISITAVGMNTGASAMKNITYNYVDMNFTDRFVINQPYQFDEDGDLSISVGYSLKGVGKTSIYWYFDGQLQETTDIPNVNPNLSGQNRTFYFNRNRHEWLTVGIHTLQMYMECNDINTNEKFYTPIYYREFIVEETPTISRTPFIIKKGEFDYENGILGTNETLLVYGGKKFENTKIEYAVYYNGQANCIVETYIAYNSENKQLITSETIPLQNGFSQLLNKSIALSDDGLATVSLRALEYNKESYFETEIKLDVERNEMDIKTVEDNVVLFLNAFGRTNKTSDKNSWVYKYTEGFKEYEITTKFSENEYVLISTRDSKGEVVKPEDANSENSEVVTYLPLVKNEEKKYLIYNDEYYVWTREFDWSDTSGWSDNKLKIGKDNMITINFQPFSDTMVKNIKERGATFEFEFETTNVYDDNAVICRICGNNNFAPGISIYASGAEMVISREIVKESEDEGSDNTNAGYMKAVSTKYKSEESNRISFVITPDIENDREKLLLIYVNGEVCGAYPYSRNENFFNDSKISFRGTDKACINISNIKLYSRRLSSSEIFDNFVYYRNNSDEKVSIYKRNDIMVDGSIDTFDSSKLLSQLPVMTFYQIHEDEGIDKIHQEKKNKKLPVHFDVTYIDIQNPDKNFVIKNAYITPQGTSSMNYPVKNFRLYTNKDKKSPATLYVGSKIFLNGDTTDLREENLNPECIVSKKKYAFKDGSIPVNCWCLKADFAESSSSHNTGTSRYWNGVLKAGGLSTKAQEKSLLYEWGEKGTDGRFYQYDIRTAIDGFPIVLFYQDMKGSTLRFEGKYNFNNDKSTEDVFGFTGGMEIPDQECVYYYIGKEEPIRHYDDEKDEWSCEFGEYTTKPTVDSPIYAIDENGNWYMLRGKELLDNPKMECWELLNSVNEIALFKTVKGFGVGDDDEKVGIVNGSNFDEAFESRYPDCGDYYHTNSLHNFAKWLVSCRYLKVDNETGKSVPFEIDELPNENYYHNEEGKLSIVSLTKQSKTFKINYPNYNFYKEVEYNSIASAIKLEGYQPFELTSGVTSEDLTYVELSEVPKTKHTEDGVTYEYIKVNGKYYCWMPSNLGIYEELPSTEQTQYDFIKVGETYFKWSNEFNFSDFYETQWVDDTPFNRALKFAVEKYDHIEMNKMAAYYIYLMRFGGVDQTVKNSMLTTEGPATNDPNSTLPSLWYFINYDNDTILGVKNDGRLVFDPYITRETKDGTGYVYAGRESTLWNNLEADIEFNEKVTAIDNQLAEGKGDAKYALSYNNALREYDTNQSDKWCERIYNRDAERKYIETYVKGWTQVTGETGDQKLVYEDYLYDVQGSRSAHRKWWLGRRFNIYDSKFCNSNFRSSFIKFRSTNLPAGSSFTIKSGEPIYYAWGHDNNVTEMTPRAIQAGENWTFTTQSTFNIGSYLELMGAANIITLDLRGCVGDLTEINVENCYSTTIGTKLKEILIGDHERNDLFNVSTTQMNFGGLGRASKLEILDITNIQNIFQLDGLENLLNIREVYAKGSKVSDYTFANGAQIETIEFSSSVKSLSLTESSTIKYSGLKFDGEGYGELSSLTIINCPNLMKDTTFVFNWLNTLNDVQKSNVNLNLQGVDWTFYGNDYTQLFILEGVGTSNMGHRSIGGNIKLNTNLTSQDVARFKKIFGDNCFAQGAALYIDAPTDIFVNMPLTIWEGSSDIRCDITLVGVTLKGTTEVSAEVIEIVDGKNETKYIEHTDGIITMDVSTLNNGYVTINVLESNRTFTNLYIKVMYTSEIGERLPVTQQSSISKRFYPTNIELITEKNSFNNFIPNPITLDYLPDEVDNTNFEGRGFFTVEWEMVAGTTDYNSKLLLAKNGETATIQARDGFDGKVTIQAQIIRNFDEKLMCSNTKQLEFTNPDTILTKDSNEPLYNIMKKIGVIIEDESGYGFLTKNDASKVEMSQFVDEKGVSVFKGNKELTSFLEMQYFNGTYMGQMPIEGIEKQLTPVGMFEDCSNLKEIAFSRTFAYANKKMFDGCTNLEYIYGPYVESTNSYNNLSFVYIGEEFANECDKLKVCNVGNSLKIVENKAFRSCISLEHFNVSSDKDLQIVHDVNSTPFENCPNISFEGVTYGGNNTYAKYQVLNGALLEVRENSLVLVHMGKDTLVSDLPTDKEIVVCARAMEYRNEEDLVIPMNFKFNGIDILKYSKGRSVKIEAIIGDNPAKGLLIETSFENYSLSNNETRIPEQLVASSSTITSLVIPETVTKIDRYPFNKNIALKDIYLYIKEPIEKLELFTNVGWINIHVPGDSYEKYLTMYPEWKVYLRKMSLPTTGHFNIIENGEYYYSIIDETNNEITIGGLPTIQRNNSYYEFNSESLNQDFIIRRNGVEIGKYTGDYCTLYLGDNSSLYTGNGIDFTRGLVTAKDLTDKNILISNQNWEYDSVVNGFKSPTINDGGSAIMILNLKDFIKNGEMYIKYSQLSESSYDYGSIYKEGSESSPYLSMRGKNGYHFEETFKIDESNSICYFSYKKDGSNSYAVDGCWIEEIGFITYNKPEYPSEYVQEIKLTMRADNLASKETFNGVEININDGKNFNETVIYNGDDIIIYLPKNEVYTVTTYNFRYGSKKYSASEPFTIDTNIDNILHDYVIEWTTIPMGIYFIDAQHNMTSEFDNTKLYEAILYSSDDADIYIHKMIYSDKSWAPSSLKDYSYYNTEENLLSEYVDGYNNSVNIISKYGSTSITAAQQALTLYSQLNQKYVEWYLPSYEELYTTLNVFDVKQSLATLIQNTVDGRAVWTSNVYDKENAWIFKIGDNTPSYEHISETNEIMIFGRPKL